MMPTSVDMSAVATIPWMRRTDLLLRPGGETGQYVVKDPQTGGFFSLGAQEHFLLSQLDGGHTVTDVCTSFERTFHEPLPVKDFQQFLELARSQGLLQPAAKAPPPVARPEFPPPPPPPAPPTPSPAATPAAAPARPRQSLLFWRKKIFDPDRLLSWLAPRLWFLWTPAFVTLSLATVALALAVAFSNRAAFVQSLVPALTWQTVVLVWLTLGAATLAHELSHGLTCKHHGGEVHEIGFLLLFLMPCFYCNVSDAWMFRERSRRLWVTLAGGYCDLCLWALAVFAWRLTVPGSMLNYLAAVVLSVLGTRVFLNLNPLLKLDGYYLLSDWLEIPNLQQRGLGAWFAHVRWLLWGGKRPSPQPRGRLLLLYGLLHWAFGLALLTLTVWTLVGFLGQRWGLVGIMLTLLLGSVVLRGSFQGMLGQEAVQMFVTRRARTLAWAGILAAAVLVLCLWTVEHRASGPFEVRPVVRAELRAPVAGFLREAYGDEGSRLSPGSDVARLEVPDLEARIREKQAERREVEARLRLLEAGPRREEIEVQRGRVARVEAACERARHHLVRARQAYESDLARLEGQLAMHRAELAYAQDVSARSRMLLDSGAASLEEYRSAETKGRLAQAQIAQAEAQRRGRRAIGVHEAELDLARWERELADARASLKLLEAGSRPEEIQAMRAHLARAQEEVRYLERLREKALVRSPVAGVVSTPRLREKIGQYLREGDLICTVEEPSALEAEITLEDQEAALVQVGQPVSLKVRALPFQSFQGVVQRIAPRATHGEMQSTVTVSCRLENIPPEFRPGLTGYAHIACGRRPAGRVLMDHVLRLLRPEFWW